MAISLVERYRETYPSGNKLVVGYTATISGAYPVSGGNVLNNTVFGSQVFSKINSAIFEFYQLNPDTDYIAKFDAPVNTDSTNPTIALRIYDEATGGMGWNEVGGGDVYGGTWYFRIEGIPVNGVDGAQI
jgi:hypothetical protein